MWMIRVGVPKQELRASFSEHCCGQKSKMSTARPKAHHGWAIFALLAQVVATGSYGGQRRYFAKPPCVGTRRISKKHLMQLLGRCQSACYLCS
jgi:hypothetical protein